jgi:hypothetical protein
MTIWVTGTVGNILHETEKTKLFIVTTDEGERLVMSARKGDGIEVEAGATSTFECDLYAVPRTIPSGNKIFRNYKGIRGWVQGPAPIERSLKWVRFYS